MAALLIILLAATGLRIHRLCDRPLGLHYDEAANGILAGEIARGLKTPIFIPSYTGKEVLFFYWTALWMKALGITTLSLRLGAATLGVITVGVSAWAVCELLRDRGEAPWIGLTSAAFLAVSFWHVLLSRYGFRAIAQPLLQALTVAALWRGIRPTPTRQRSWRDGAWLVLAGLFCGLTAYTYLAARAFPVPLAVALAALVAADRRHRRQRLGQVLIFVSTAALTLAPLAHYWLTHPGSFSTRARQVAAASWRDAWRGLVACLKMLFVEGDPYVRFNLPGRPLFGPFVAALFLLGLGAAIWQVTRLLRSSRRAEQPVSLAALVFLVVLLPVMLLPSALATDEITPSNLRTVGLLPFVYVFPALGIGTLATLWRRVNVNRFGGRVGSGLFPVACLFVLAFCGARTARGYYTWSSSPALYYATDGELVDIADYLNDSDLSSATPYVASQHYRHPTVAFLADDYDCIRWLIGGSSLVFPPDGEALLVVPRSASQDLDWVRSMVPEHALADAPPGPDGEPGFWAYRLEISEAPTPSRQRTANLGHVAELLGYTVTNQPRSGESVEVAVWWTVTGPANQPDYRPVVRLTDPWGSSWGESQPLHYPSEQWREGELIIDHPSIPVEIGTPPGNYVIQFGLYAPGANVQLPVLDDRGAYAGQHVALPVTVRRAAAAGFVEELRIENRLDAAINGLMLLGTRLDRTVARPGETVPLTLFWRAEETPLPAYEIRIGLGEITLHQGAPVHDTYPFSSWEAGEMVTDRYNPRLPLDTPAGQHPLVVEIRDENTRTLTLGEITVQAVDRNFDIPTLSHSVGITLGRSVEILGYNLSSDSVSAGETLTVTITWRALREMTTDYTVFAHLLAPDGSMTGQQDVQPVAGSYPTTLWAPGEVVSDVYQIPVDRGAPRAEHRLEVGMYIAETGSRLAVPGQEDDAVTLQRVRVTD